MNAVVIDASITMSWCFEDEATPGADAVLDQLRERRAIVPALWHFEITNVLLVAERRDRMTEAKAARFIALLGSLPIDIDSAPIDVTALVGLGRRHNLSAYDAAYLELAERFAAPLATLDLELATAARAAGVAVLPR